MSMRTAMMGRRIALFMLGAVVVVCHVAAAGVAANIVNTKVDRKLDLATQTVRIFSTIKFENRGTSPVRSYLLALSPSDASHLAFIGVTQGKGRSQASLAVSPVTNHPKAPAGVSLYEVSLPRPLGGGESATLEVTTVHTGAEVPYPAEISQSEEQLVLYQGSVHLVSPYPTATQTSKVVLPTSLVKAYTKTEPVKKAGTEITYGPYGDVAAFTIEELKIHFENNSPFAVGDLEREVVVSQWGNVYVTEHYKLRNAGARHKGTFSRFEYQARPGMSGQNAIRELLARLPPRAQSLYYRDEIGNISTSHVRSTSRLTEVQLEPRYPLMGGWKTEFTVGYTLPRANVLSTTKDGRRLVNITFGCPLRDVVIDNLTVKVILPEGSTNVSAEVPFPVSQSRDARFTFLDIVGCPVLLLTKSNAVMEHNQNFQVLYRFSSAALLTKPLLLVGTLVLLFLASRAALNMDFTIAKSSATYQANLHRHKVRDLLSRLSALLSSRSSEGDKLEFALKDLSRSGDIAAARAARKSVESSLKESAKALKALQDELDAAADPKAVAKAAAAVSKEREKVAAQTQLHETAVGAWEKKLPDKDGDTRTEALQQRIRTLKKELRDLVQDLKD